MVLTNVTKHNNMFIIYSIGTHNTKKRKQFYSMLITYQHIIKLSLVTRFFKHINIILCIIQ